MLYWGSGMGALNATSSDLSSGVAEKKSSADVDIEQAGLGVQKEFCNTWNDRCKSKSIHGRVILSPVVTFSLHAHSIPCYNNSFNFYVLKVTES